MHNTLLLTRVLLKNTFSPSKNADGFKMTMYWIGGILLGIVMALFAGLQFFVIFDMGMVKMGMQMLFFMLLLFEMVQLIYMLPTTFYFSQDISMLLPLPLKPFQILLAKSIVVLVSLLPITLVIMVGGLGGGIAAHVLTPLGGVMLVLTCLLLPVSLMAILGIVFLVVMRFLPFFRNKDLFNLICGLFAIVFAIGISMASMYSGQAMASNENLTAIIAGKPEIMSMGSSIFFQVNCAVDAILDGSWFGLVLCVLSVAIPLGLAAWLSSILYLPAVMSTQGSSSKKKKLSLRAQKDPLWKLFVMNDIRELFRTPVYLMNCVIAGFIGPLMIGGMIMLNPMIQDAREITGAIDVTALPSFWTYPILIAFVLLLFLGTSNSIAATVISRTGSNGLRWMQSIPVSLRTQMRYKLIVAVVMTVIPNLLYIVVLHYLFSYPVWADLLFALAMTLVSIPASQAGIWLDIVHPKLDWISENEAVKNNYNSVIILFLDMGLAAAVALIVFFAFPNFEIITIALIILFAAMIPVFDILIAKSLEKHFG